MPANPAANELNIQKYLDIFYKYKWHSLIPAVLVMTVLGFASTFLPSGLALSCFRRWRRAGGVNCITFDVENYFQVESPRPHMDFRDWPTHELRVGANTRRLLAILSEHDVRPTFFVLGWIAERIPEIVREIHDSGHEVACHGYAHRMIGEQTSDQFRRDVSIFPVRHDRYGIPDGTAASRRRSFAPSFPHSDSSA